MILKRLPARFYRTESGWEPVREWLKGLPPEDRQIMGEDIKDVEFAWPLGLPLVRPGSKHIDAEKIARVIFCLHDEHMILLHAFIKKTQKTPPQEIELALRRMKGEKR